jgi:hypothetical protein
MKNFAWIPFIVLMFLASSCATAPMSPDEFKQKIPGAFMGKVVNLEVDRPFNQVANSYKKMAPQCLNKRITTTSTTYNEYGGQTSRVVSDYKATVVAKKDMAEIYVQQKFVSGVMSIGKEPTDGHYLLVADAVPAGKKKTKVTIYTASVYKKLIAGVENWSKGKHLGPDLTQ